MNLLRRVLLLKTIYAKPTLQGIFMVYFYATLLVFMLAFFDLLRAAGQHNQLAGAAVFAIGAIYIYALTRSIAQNLISQRLVKKLERQVVTDDAAMAQTSSLNQLLDGVDDVRVLRSDEHELSYLATFNYYWESRGGKTLVRQHYYTVVAIELNRQLPRILFDSAKAHHRQFKHLYLKSQRLSVQGPFDRYFDTYAPEGYQIDSLSFITPEVMEAMVDARAYDIEIVDNRLLLYGPLATATELDIMCQHAQAITTKLQDNIVTYRDDRLTGLARQQQVTPFARSLMESPFKYQLQATAAGLALLVELVAWIKVGSQFDPRLVVITAFYCGVNVVKVRHITQANHRAESMYYYLYQTNRGRPIKQTVETAGIK